MNVRRFALQVGNLEPAANAAPEIGVAARERIDGRLVDVDRFLGGGGAADRVGYCLLLRSGWE